MPRHDARAARAVRHFAAARLTRAMRHAAITRRRSIFTRCFVARAICARRYARCYAPRGAVRARHV